MKYTLEGDRWVEQCIQKQLDTAVKIILLHVKKPPVGIILCGGFGRGEGTVVKEGQLVRPVNDYDFLIVTDEKPLDMSILAKKLANALTMKLLDIRAISPDELNKLPISQWAYDLKYGSKVIFGDKSLLQLIPDFSAEQIPVWEAIKLLCNRMAGILGALSYDEAMRSLIIKDQGWFRVQVDHMLIACGDAALIRYGYYHHLYRERLRRLFTCIDWFSEFELEKIAESYRRKLSVWDTSMLIQCEFDLPLIEVIAEKSYLNTIKSYLRGKITTLSKAIQIYMKVHQSPFKQRLRQYIANILRFRRRHNLNAIPVLPIHVCCTFIPIVFFSGPWQEDVQKKSALMKLFRELLPHRSRVPKEYKWEQLRDMVYLFWELHCH